jgi:hypothetical protein
MGESRYSSTPYKFAILMKSSGQIYALAFSALKKECITLLLVKTVSVNWRKCLKI